MSTPRKLQENKFFYSSLYDKNVQKASLLNFSTLSLHNKLVIYDENATIQSSIYFKDVEAFLVSEEQYRIYKEFQRFNIPKLSSQQLKMFSESRKMMVMKTSRCVNLINREEALLYSKQLIKELIVKSEQMAKQPNHCSFSNQLQNVLKYYEMKFLFNEDRFIIVTEDYSSFKNLGYFINRQRVLKMPSQYSFQSIYIRPTMLLSTNLSTFRIKQEGQLSQLQILEIGKKIAKGFISLRNIEHQSYKRKLLEKNIILEEINDYQIQNQRYLNQKYSIKPLLKSFSPENDVLVHPQTGDIKLYNFGFKQDFSHAKQFFRLHLNDCTFVYRHPKNIRAQESDSKSRYNTHYLENGLRQEDLVWQLGLILFRLRTGYFPFTDQQGQQLQRIKRKDYLLVLYQMERLSQIGLFTDTKQQDIPRSLKLADSIIKQASQKKQIFLVNIKLQSILKEIQIQIQNEKKRLNDREKQKYYSRKREQNKEIKKYTQKIAQNDLENLVDKQTNENRQIKKKRIVKSRRLIRKSKKKGQRDQNSLLSNLSFIRDFIKQQLKRMMEINKSIVEILGDQIGFNQQESSRDFSEMGQTQVIQMVKNVLLIIGFRLIMDIKFKIKVLIQKKMILIDRKIRKGLANSVQNQKQFLMKLWRQFQLYKEHIKKIGLFCKRNLYSYSKNLLNLLEVKQEVGGELGYLLDLSKKYIRLFEGSEEITNTNHKADFIKQQSQFERSLEYIKYLGSVEQQNIRDIKEIESINILNEWMAQKVFSKLRDIRKLLQPAVLI